MIPAWLLPEYVEDVLPGLAWRMERARRDLLDLFRRHGYELVLPPMLEYLPSLQAGVGNDLVGRTFHVVDQLSGRLMGLRADMTPQAARIDAHLMHGSGVNRLCYAGSVLRSCPSAFGENREPLQVGAELFGHAGIEADVEIQQLLLKSLKILGVPRVHLDLGHVAVSRSLVESAGLDKEGRESLFAALQAKDNDALAQLCQPLETELAGAIRALPRLYGGSEVIGRARTLLPSRPEILKALDELEVLARRLEEKDVEICLDLAELRGWRYHNGVVFSVYAAGSPRPLALGGRYDGVGGAFGAARPATGFSLDLRNLVEGAAVGDSPSAICAPALEDGELQAVIEQLRAEGDAVRIDLAGEGAVALGCRKELRKVAAGWNVFDCEGIDPE